MSKRLKIAQTDIGQVTGVASVYAPVIYDLNRRAWLHGFSAPPSLAQLHEIASFAAVLSEFCARMTDEIKKQEEKKIYRAMLQGRKIPSDK